MGLSLSRFTESLIPSCGVKSRNEAKQPESFIRAGGLGDDMLDPLNVRGVGAGKSGPVLEDAGQVVRKIGAIDFDAEFVGAGRAQHRLDYESAERWGEVAVFKVVLHAAGDIPLSWHRFGCWAGVAGKV